MNIKFHSFWSSVEILTIEVSAQVEVKPTDPREALSLGGRVSGPASPQNLV